MTDDDSFNDLRARVMGALGVLNRLILETAAVGRLPDVRFAEGHFLSVTEVDQYAVDTLNRYLGEAIAAGHAFTLLIADVTPRGAFHVGAETDVIETGHPPAVEHRQVNILFDKDRYDEYVTLPA